MDRPSSLFAREDHERMLGVITDAARCQVAYCAAKFSLAEHLARGPVSAEAVARAEGLDPDATFRLLRACAAFGLARHDPGAGFSGTPFLATLRRDDPGSLHGSVLSMLGHGFGLLRAPLDAAIRTGKPQIEATLGSSTWDYYKTEAGADEARAFAQAMAATSQAFNARAAEIFDTRGVRYALDVGGADGGLVQALMQADAALQGGVLELAHAAGAAEAAAREKGLGERFRIHAGDFLTEVPPADLYLLKWILHDWSDADCLTMLRNCRASLMPGGRLMVVEMVLDGGTPTPFAATVDLNMLVTLGARERTFEEYAALLAEAGFGMARPIAGAPPFSVIEARAD